MGRPRKNKEVSPPTLVEKVESANQDQEIGINDMPLDTLGDYVRYNRRARAANHKLGVCRYKIKQCPPELHPTQRVIVVNTLQPTNPFPVFLSNEYIHFDKKLYPGVEYDLPNCIVDYLADKGSPNWQLIKKTDGSEEAIKVSETPRFSIRSVRT